MKIAVRYYSKSGSTKKLAEALGAGIGVQAESIEVPLSEPVDLLFIGGAPYIASQLAPELRHFISQLTVNQVKAVAAFSTSNWKLSIHNQVKRSLKDPQIELFDETYQSRGALKNLINQTHPNLEEQAEAVNFAKQIIAEAKAK